MHIYIYRCVYKYVNTYIHIHIYIYVSRLASSHEQNGCCLHRWVTGCLTGFQGPSKTRAPEVLGPGVAEDRSLVAFLLHHCRTTRNSIIGDFKISVDSYELALQSRGYFTAVALTLMVIHPSQPPILGGRHRGV